MCAPGDPVDVAAAKGKLSPNVLLFEADGYSAWDDHFVKHVFSKEDDAEWLGWQLLSARLRAALVGTTIDALESQARERCDPREKHALWNVFREYLCLVRDAIEKSVELCWFWEEADTWKAFSPYAVFGVFDSEKLRTGFLPRGPDVAPSATDRLLRYNLFLKCLRKVRDKYQIAVRRHAVTAAACPAFDQVMRNEPTIGAWENF
jgi:hypothetical protein